MVFHNGFTKTHEFDKILKMEKDTKTKSPAKPPSYDMGKAQVDVSNREALYTLMESHLHP